MTNDTNTTNTTNSSNALERLKQILGTKLTLSSLTDAGRWIAKKANQALPGATGPEKKAWGK